ncbi:MAG: hypothetical protein ACODAD_05835 [Planctomycetota bacterium]
MLRRRFTVRDRMVSVCQSNEGILTNFSGRVRGRITQAKSGLVEEDYSLPRMMAEFTRFILVGSMNVFFFFGVNYLFNVLNLSAYKSLSVWAPSWLIGALEAHAAHRWMTFRSRINYRDSLVWGGIVYGVTAMMSTFSVYFLADLLQINYWGVWAMNTFAFGGLTFLGLRYLAFPPLLGSVEDTRVGLGSAEEN